MTLESFDRLVAFIPATDLPTARAFYGDILGLEVITIDDDALVARSGRTDLRITKVETFSPQPFTVLGWTVTNVRGVIAQLVERGVEFLRFDGMHQDDDGVWAAPSGALVAWFRDPDGNTLSFTQVD